MRIKKLDGLRGICSVMVVIYHYSQDFLPYYLYNFFIIRESHTFVDFFFVLSGFVIAHNYHSLSNFKDFWTYLKKRFIRLYPLLFYTVNICLVAMIVSNNFLTKYIDEGSSLMEHIYTTLDSLTFLNSTPLLGDSLGMNHPSWSISAEMISYIVFGLLSVILIKNLKIVLFLCIMCLSTITLLDYGTFFVFGDYGFIRGLMCFLVGYFIWELNLLKFQLNNYLEYTIPFLLTSILYILHINVGNSIRVYFEFLVPVIFGLSIFILIKTNGWISRILEKEPMQFLGRISYSTYLNHFIILYIFPNILFKVLSIPNNDTIQIIIFILCLILTILYSNFTYKHVEIRGSKFLRKHLLK